MRMLAVGALVATALLLVWLRNTDRADDLAKAAARCDHRVLEARISGFVYQPYVARTARAIEGSTESRRLDAMAQKILVSSAGAADSEHLHQAALAALLLSRPREALKLMESAVAADSGNPVLWNDLAVVRYTASMASDDPYELVEALAAANRAVTMRSHFAEANFNAALILEKLGLRDAARVQFGRSLNAEAGSAWATEAAARAARLRQRTLSDDWERSRPLMERSALVGDFETVRRIVADFPQPARTWSETIYLKNWGDAIATGDIAAADKWLALADSIGHALGSINGDTLLQEIVNSIQVSDKECVSRLALGHRLYYEARIFYEKREVAKSLPTFMAAAKNLDACGSPMRKVALNYVNSALFDEGRTAEAAAGCQSLLAESDMTHIALRAQILWTLANVQLRQGLLHLALSSQEKALILFLKAGEGVNSAAMERQVAGTLSVLGRRTEAWRLRITNFGRISRLGDNRGLQSALDVAARTEAIDDRWDTAIPLLALATDSRLRQNPRVYASSLVWYALASQQLRLPDSEGRLRMAIHAADMLKDRTMRLRAIEDLTLVEAIGVRSSDARRAARLLDGYISDAERYDNRLFLPEAYLQRALTAETLGEKGMAETDLRHVLRLLADRRTTPVEQRSTYFRTGDLATRELVDLMVRRGAVADALALLDESRAKAIGLNTVGSPQSRVQKGPLVEYLAFPDKLLIFIANERRVRATYVPVGEAQLRQTAHQFVQDVLNDDRSPQAESFLERWLIVPIVAEIGGDQTVFIVPDRVMKRIPFGALRTPDRRYLVEHAAVVLTPTSRLALRRKGVLANSVVAVGAPLLDGPLSDLPQLPNAAHEAALVARAYPKATLLRGSMATAANVLAAAQRASVLHLAVHAVVVPSESSQSYLALGSSPGMPGMLTLARIERAVLRSRPVVVLAGCRTADEPDRVPKAFSIAEAFLAAGASTVVATLWDIPDDSSSERFSLSFHEQLRKGKTPASAVRSAQLTMLHSSDPRLRRRSAWCAFQTYGAD